jgi:hypothetical protein
MAGDVSTEQIHNCVTKIEDIYYLKWLFRGFMQL